MSDVMASTRAMTRGNDCKVPIASATASTARPSGPTSGAQPIPTSEASETNERMTKRRTGTL